MLKLSMLFKNPRIIFYAMAVALALIVLCFLNFRIQVNSYTDEEMRAQIDAVRQNSVLLVQNEMNYLKRLTASTAQLVSRMELHTDEDILRTLQDFAGSSNVVRTLFVTLDGHAYTSYMGYLGQSEANTAIDGILLSEISAPIFSQPQYADALNEVIFGVVAPATMAGKKGVLVSSYNIKEFAFLLENKLIDGAAEIGIIKSGGEVVSGKSDAEFNANIFDSLALVSFEQSSADTMRRDFANGKSGLSIYAHKGVSRYCSYAPVGLNDWYVVVTVKENVLRLKLKNLEQYGLQLTVELVLVMLGLLVVVLTSRVWEQKKVRMILEHAAMMDGLTGIYNRMASEQTIGKILENAGENADCVLLVVDVDDFKQINDQRGHLFGDHVLKECANRLQHVFGEEGIVGRIGGDEFVVFIRDGRNVQRIEEKIERMNRDFYALTEAGTHQEITISVGIAQTEQGADSFLALYRLADAALYRAKQAGKKQLCH